MSRSSIVELHTLSHGCFFTQEIHEYNELADPDTVGDGQGPYTLPHELQVNLVVTLLLSASPVGIVTAVPFIEVTMNKSEFIAALSQHGDM